MNSSHTEQSESFLVNSEDSLLQQSQKNEMNVSRLRKRTSLKKKVKTVKKKGNEKVSKTFNSSLWVLKENVLYMQFLLENQQMFYTSKQRRKFIKLNVMMARRVKTRSADQCRSHHQKMMKYHQDIPNIIRHIEKLMDEQKSIKVDVPQKLQNLNEEVEPLAIESALLWTTNNMPDPLYDWEQWINWNQIEQEKKYVEEWFECVDAKYSIY